MHPEQAARRGQYDSMETLKDRFDVYMESLTANAPASFINEKRAAILSRCRKMAESLPGFFSLTVPTGGGKTLASMAWALLHAVRYKKNGLSSLFLIRVLLYRRLPCSGIFSERRMWWSIIVICNRIVTTNGPLLCWQRKIGMLRSL